jgi:hypothetical protein
MKEYVSKNTGAILEENVYSWVEKAISNDEFLVSEPNIKIFKHKKYYSKEREAYITVDVSVEKYLVNPDENNEIPPSIIIILECKDYKKSISVDEVEEFHAKLQQIGADKTKGIMVTSKGAFQKSALNYAKTKGIALIRIMPNEQLVHICYRSSPSKEYRKQEKERALIEIKHCIDANFIHKNFICSEEHFYSFSTIIINYLGLYKNQPYDEYGYGIW